MLTVSAVAAAGCAKKHQEPANAPPGPRLLTAWPQGHTPALKITDSLVLVIPLPYERSAIDGAQTPRAPFPGVSGRTEARFDFFLPDFSGYTLQNYRNDFDPNKVEVSYLHAGDSHEADPGAAGEYPPNMLKRLLGDFLIPEDYKDMYGLRCYQSRVLTDRLTCYGTRDAAAREDILLYVPVTSGASQSPFPTLRANYFSARYGGVRIAWRTHVRNLPRWHNIDAQIWRFIEEWRVPEPPAAPTPPSPPPSPPSPAGR